MLNGKLLLVHGETFIRTDDKRHKNGFSVGNNKQSIALILCGKRENW
jgi:hypothetical protein